MHCRRKTWRSWLPTSLAMTSWLGMKKSSAIFRDFAGASVLLEVDADFAEGGRLRPRPRRSSREPSRREVRRPAVTGRTDRRLWTHFDARSDLSHACSFRCRIGGHGGFNQIETAVEKEVADL